MIGLVVGNTAGRPGLIDEAADLGVEWIRLDVYWNEIERSPGVYSWWIAQDIERASTRGLRIYATIQGTPAWASASGEAREVPPWHRWRRFVRAAVDRFPEVEVWGLWNEPDSRRFFLGTREAYEALVLHAAPIIRGRGKKVAAPEVSTNLLRSPWWVWKYLRSPAGRWTDVVSVHHYAPPWATALYIRLLGFLGVRRIWLTEFGRSRKQTEFEQATHLRKTLRNQRRNGRWEVAMPYVWESNDRPYVIRGRAAEIALLGEVLRRKRESKTATGGT